MRETVGVKGERFLLKGRSAVEFTPANDWLLLILATRTRRCGRADSDIVECDLEGLPPFDRGVPAALPVLQPVRLPVHPHRSVQVLQAVQWGPPGPPVGSLTRAPVVSPCPVLRR